MSQNNKSSKKQLSKRKKLIDYFDQLGPDTHPNAVMKLLESTEASFEDGKVQQCNEGDLLYRAITMKEFEVGVLSNEGFQDYMKTFSIDLSIKLQKEYECRKASDRATAHLAAHSYCRILDLQRRIKAYLDKGTLTKIGSKFLDFLSKDLDRAERHYFNAIQTLEMMKQSPIKLTVKADQANFAQNMVAHQGK